jgi:hypothetical protein
MIPREMLGRERVDGAKVHPFAGKATGRHASVLGLDLQTVRSTTTGPTEHVSGITRTRVRDHLNTKRRRSTEEIHHKCAPGSVRFQEILDACRET